MVEEFLSKIIEIKENEKLSREDIVFSHTTKFLVPSAFVIIIISIYWLVVDMFSSKYNLNLISRIGVMAQFTVSLFIILAFINKKKYSTTITRITYFAYYFSIIFGVTILILSRNKRIVQSGIISNDIGISIAAFYFFVMSFMPMPRFKDSVIVTTAMAIGIVLPEVLVMTSIYSICCSFLLSASFITVYYVYRHTLLKNAEHEINNNKLNNLLSVNSYTDSLTGILNRRSMDEYINYLCKHSKANKMGVIVFDMDFFKKYNDYYGHFKSDEILADVAKTIEAYLSQFESCYLFRYGGEEFVAVLDNAEPLMFKQIMIGIKKTILDKNYKRDDIEEYDRLTVSIGGAIEEIPSLNDDYVSRAELQLYLGKNSNRNAIFFENNLLDNENSIDVANNDSKLNYNYSMSQILLSICDSLTDIFTVDVLSERVNEYRKRGNNIKTDFITSEYDYEYLTKQYIDKIIHPLDKKMMEEKLVFRNIINIIKKEGKANFYYRALVNNEVCHYELRCLPYYKNDKINKVVFAISNEEIDMNKSQLAAILETDELTNVYTKKAFYLYANKFINDHRDRKYAVIICDLVNFRMVNKIYGTIIGDNVIKYVAKKFVDTPQCKVIGRFAGDELSLLYELDTNGELDNFQATIDMIKNNAPVQFLNVKYGIYKDFAFNEQIENVCDKALQALKSIKQNVSNVLAYYNEEINNEYYHKQMFENDFENALKNKEFIVNCQPKYNTSSKRICGGESLVRWKTSNGQIIKPFEFISIFENNGQIFKLDEYVFDYVCNRQKQLLDKGITPLPVSVNVSRSTLFQQGMLERYDNIIEKYGLDKKFVPIEITESSNVETDRIKQLIELIKSHGFVLHMDDFGSGYSSLASISIIPVDVIKLDKSLIDNIGTDNGDELLRHIIELAHFSKMDVVAEGVETNEQYNFLNNLNCDEIQGYYFNSSLDFDEYEKLIIADYNTQKVSDSIQEENVRDTNISSFKITNEERLSYLLAMSSIYMTMHVINLVENTVIEFTTTSVVKPHVNKGVDAKQQMNAAMNATVAPEYRDEVLKFVDLDTLPSRMKNLRSISIEFKGTHFGLCKAQFIVISKNNEDEPTKVIYTTQVLDTAKDGKQNDILDETTGAFNKTVYDEDLYKYNESSIVEYSFNKNTVALVLKIKDLKENIDLNGNAAGDEILVEVAVTLGKELSERGRVYRVNDDEFIAIFKANAYEIDQIKQNIDNEFANWMGVHTKKLDVVYEIASQIERKADNIYELVDIAKNRLQLIQEP